MAINKRFIEATSQFKSINVYDSNMQRILNKQLRGEREGQKGANTVQQDGKKECQ
jgi:hypothetical protein